MLGCFEVCPALQAYDCDARVRAYLLQLRFAAQVTFKVLGVGV